MVRWRCEVPAMRLIFVDEGASVRVRLFASALSEALKSEGLQVEGPMTQLLCFAARAQ